MGRCTSFWSSISKNGQAIGAFTIPSSKCLRRGGPGPLITLKWAICSPNGLASRDSRDKRPADFRKLDLGPTSVAAGVGGGAGRDDATAIYRWRRRERLQYRNSRSHDDLGRAGGQDNGEKRHNAFIAVADRRHDCSRFGFHYRARVRSHRLVVGLLVCRRGARLQARVFCIRQLHDAGLWRRDSSAAMATARPDYGDERRIAVWLVDRRYFRDPAQDDGRRRLGGPGTRNAR